MRKNKKNNLVFYLLTLFIFIMLFSIKKFSQYSLVVITTFLLIFTSLTYLTCGFKKSFTTILDKQIIKYLSIYSLAFYIIIYLFGFAIGYNENSLTNQNLISVLFYLLNIIFLEIIRYIIINRDTESRKDIIIIACLITIINILLLKYFTNLKLLLIIIVCANSLFSTFLSLTFGYKVTLIYRLLLEHLLFFIPIIPAFNSFWFILLYIGFIILTYRKLRTVYSHYERDNFINFVPKSYRLIYIPFCLIFIFTIVIISSKANIFLMGIASNSMAPSIRRGDAVLVKKVKDNTVAAVDDIVIFKHKNKMIAHRIIEIVTKDKEKYYVTKGDNNKKPDEALLKVNEVEGIVCFKIPYLAYPSIKSREIISKRKEG